MHVSPVVVIVASVVSVTSPVHASSEIKFTDMVINRVQAAVLMWPQLQHLCWVRHVLLSVVIVPSELSVTSPEHASSNINNQKGSMVNRSPQIYIGSYFWVRFVPKVTFGA